jgi:Tfp pilus assembly protein PilN
MSQGLALDKIYMIEINLLPEEMRREKKLQFKLDLATSKVQFIAGSILAGILIALFIFCLAGSLIRKAQTISLLKKERSIAHETSEVDAINKKITTLNAKLAALDGVTKRKFLWAGKLNQLSELTLPGIWFTRIYTDTENRFIIEGSIISRREEAMATVGKFMKDMRENQVFFNDFSDIKLESAQRKTLDERDVVDFRIALYFK